MNKNLLKLLLYIACPILIVYGVGVMSTIEWCHPDETDRRLFLDYWPHYLLSVFSVICGVSCFTIASFLEDE